MYHLCSSHEIVMFIKTNIIVIVTQWLERLTSHQKVADSLPVWSSENVFLKFEADESPTVIHENLKASIFKILVLVNLFTYLYILAFMSIDYLSILNS